MSRILVVSEEGTCEQTGSLTRTVPVPVLEETIELIDCHLSKAVICLPTGPVAEVIEGSWKIEERGDEVGAIAGRVTLVAGASPLPPAHCGGGGGGRRPGRSWHNCSSNFGKDLMPSVGLKTRAPIQVGTSLMKAVPTRRVTTVSLDKGGFERSHCEH